jgi:hypothetical protein
VPVFANNAANEKHFLASFSGVLQMSSLKSGKISTTNNILNSNRWSHVYWPSYDDEKYLYFVARDRLEKEAGTNIYRLSLLDLEHEPIKIIGNARLPSIAPNNNIISFYRHPNQLWIKSFGEVNSRMVANDISNYQPCVWVSNTHLLYIDLANNLLLLDLSKSIKKKTGYKNVVPSALSPDGEKVLCGSSDGKKIYFYFPSSNGLKLQRENKFLSLGTSFIWLPDGSGFLFTMQTWSNTLRLNESRDLFIYRLNGDKITNLVGRVALFGGIFILPK